MTLGKKLIAVACLLVFASGADARPVFPKLRAKIDAKRGVGCGPAKPAVPVTLKPVVVQTANGPTIRGGCVNGKCPLR